MTKNKDPRVLADALIRRSICAVQVSAVLADAHGVFAWGWNSVGDGFGQHAEAHCLQRANRKRAAGATLYVAARRKRNKRMVTARPCPSCQLLIKDVQRVIYREADGTWRQL